MLLPLADVSALLDSDAAKIGFGLIVMIAIGLGLSMLRDLRKSITSEVRMQLREEDENGDATKIPQPFIIANKVEFTPLDKHNSLVSEFEKLRDQRTRDVHGLHLKIEQGLQKTSDSISPIALKVAQLQVSQESQSRELHAIRVEQKDVGLRIDAIPSRVVQTLKDTKGLL